MIAGSPRLLTMALTDELWMVLVIAFGAGLAIAAVNPILMAVSYERIPAHLRGRVLGVVGALSFAGLPAGGLLGGLAVDGAGLRTALLGVGALYLAVTLTPFLILDRLGHAFQPPPSSDLTTARPETKAPPAKALPTERLGVFRRPPITEPTAASETK